MRFKNNKQTVGEVSIEYDKNLKKFVITDFTSENFQFIKPSSGKPEPTSIKYFKETFIEKFKNSAFYSLGKIFTTIDSYDNLNFYEMAQYEIKNSYLTKHN